MIRHLGSALLGSFIVSVFISLIAFYQKIDSESYEVNTTYYDEINRMSKGGTKTVTLEHIERLEMLAKKNNEAVDEHSKRLSVDAALRSEKRISRAGNVFTLAFPTAFFLLLLFLWLRAHS